MYIRMIRYFTDKNVPMTFLDLHTQVEVQISLNSEDQCFMKNRGAQALRALDPSRKGGRARGAFCGLPAPYMGYIYVYMLLKGYISKWPLGGATGPLWGAQAAFCGLPAPYMEYI